MLKKRPGAKEEARSEKRGKEQEKRPVSREESRCKRRGQEQEKRPQEQDKSLGAREKARSKIRGNGQESLGKKFLETRQEWTVDGDRIRLATDMATASVTSKI